MLVHVTYSYCMATSVQSAEMRAGKQLSTRVTKRTLSYAVFDTVRNLSWDNPGILPFLITKDWDWDLGYESGVQIYFDIGCSQSLSAAA